jgi:hypothetical protein
METGGGFDATVRRQLELLLRDGLPLSCPFCDLPLSVQPVERSGEVAYVRRRVWVLCAGCRRSAGLDAADRPSRS